MGLTSERPSQRDEEQGRPKERAVMSQSVKVGSRLLSGQRFPELLADGAWERAVTLRIFGLAMCQNGSRGK